MFSDEDYQKKRAERQKIPNEDQRWRYQNDDSRYDDPDASGLPLSDQPYDREERRRHLDHIETYEDDHESEPIKDHSINGRHQDEQVEKRSVKRQVEDQFKQGPKPLTVVLGILGILVLVVFVIGIIAIVNFFSDLGNDQRTPAKAATMMMEAVGADDYATFLTLLNGEEYGVAPAETTPNQDDNAEPIIHDTPEIRQLFEGLRNRYHESSVMSDYVLVRQQNGQDILIALEYNEDKKVFEIHDVRVLESTEREAFSY